MKKTQIKRVISVLMIALLIIALTSCEACNRVQKSIDSSFNGLERKITVYNSAGKLIFEDEGVIDVAENEYGNKVIFDMDGKRYAFYNCSVMIVEK